MYCKIEHRVDYRESSYQSYTEEEFCNIIYENASELNINSLPDILFFNKESPIGYCSGKVIEGTYFATGLGFNIALLDGSSFTKVQINDVIRHELAHLLTNRKYGENCEHDDRWRKVAENCGCNPDEYLCPIMQEANVRITRIDKKQSGYHFFMECSKCGKELLKTKTNLINILGLFLLSNEENPLPITVGKLEVKTSCCKSPYRFIGDIRKVISVLNKEDQLNSVKEILEKMLVAEVEIN
jgi:predicted SprT family Zn-dependent metalloprotease